MGAEVSNILQQINHQIKSDEIKLGDHIEPSKIVPPMNHQIKSDKIKLGDHIYRRLKGNVGIFWDHHGVVVDVNDGNVKVMHLTEDGIRIQTLSEFLDGLQCRLVYYDTSKFYQTFQRAGTCHTERESPIQEVLKRVNHTKTNLVNHEHFWTVCGMNCEEFAIYIKTGLWKGTEVSQIKNVVITNAIILVLKKAAKAVVNLTDDVAASVVKSTTTEVIQNTTKAAVSGMIAGCGIAVGCEVALSVMRVVKYLNDYQYLWCDLWKDMGRSWITTTVCTGIGVSSLAIGWWAILPVVGAGFLLEFIFHYFKVFDRKSHKEKVYNEYKLNQNSTTKELKIVRRKIKKQIKDEKLHPDLWKSETFEKKWWQKYSCLDRLFKGEEAKRMEKYMWMTAFLDMLHEDIQREYVLFDGDKPKEQQLIKYHQ